jgi:pimeloyl-ACP methyl ester carboxylesterase
VSWLKRLVVYPLLAVTCLCLAWVAWSLVAYRDIPVAELEARYGDATLAVVEIDGVPLRYRVEGSGPALLLIHSHYFNMRLWDDWIPALRDEFRVIRFDMTSHGLTGPEPRGDYSMARDVALIEGLLDHLGVDRFSVAGSSLGGNMAFHLASRHPERVDRLVLMNSGGLPREGSRANSGTIPGWVDYLSYLVPTAAFRAFLEWMIVDDDLVTPALAREFHDMFRRQGNRFAEFDRMRGFAVGDPAPVLAQITAPTLIMWGADNPQLPVEQAAKFEPLLSAADGVERRVYPGVGHVIPIEMPEQGSRELRRFLLGAGQ